jgi:hypothetical protein
VLASALVFNAQAAQQGAVFMQLHHPVIVNYWIKCQQAWFRASHWHVLVTDCGQGPTFQHTCCPCSAQQGHIGGRDVAWATDTELYPWTWIRVSNGLAKPTCGLCPTQHVGHGPVSDPGDPRIHGPSRLCSCACMLTIASSPARS